MINKKELKPDFDHWGKMAFWTLKESVFLLNDIDPNLFETYATPTGRLSYDNRVAEKPPHNVIRLFEVALRAIASGEIGPKRPIVGEETQIEPSEMVLWAFQNRFDIPDELKKSLNKKLRSHQEEKLPSLDPTHKYYPTELAIAIKTWVRFFDEEKIKTKHGFKDQISAWLQENYSELSDYAIERIATVVNPNKKGGAPPSDDFGN